MSTTQVNEQQSCLNLVNTLISKSLTRTPVSSIDEIDAILIISLCEAITGRSVPDIIKSEDQVSEAHNVQAAIDMLSLDILGISLSHITGEAVVAKDLTSIFNLLQVLEGVMNLLPDSMNGQRVRKVSRLKKRKSGTKENFISGSAVTKSNDIVDSKTPSINNTEYLSSVISRSRIVKSSSPKVKHKVRSHIDTNGKFFNKSSRKESSGMSLKSNFKLVGKPNPHNENKISTDEVGMNVTDHISLSESAGFSNRTVTSRNVSYAGNDNISVIQSVPVIQHKICTSSSNFQSSRNKESIENLCERNLELKVKAFIDKNSPIRSRSSCLKKRYLQSLKRPLKKTPLSPSKKSFLLPSSLRRKRVCYKTVKPVKIKSCTLSEPFASKTSMFNVKASVTSEQQPVGLIRELTEEFPGIHLSPSIMNHIQEKYEQHLLKLHKRVKNCILQKPKTQIQSEKAKERQQKIESLLKKDMKEQKFLKEIKEQKEKENQLKYRLRDSRLQSVKMKQYCSEFQDEMRKKMQKGNSAEELIFEKVFKEVINIQKDHVEQLCQNVKESDEEDSKRHLDYLASLENLYQSQFAMLSEILADERKDAQERYKVEKQILDKMERDFQQMLKQDIRFMQKATVDLVQDQHFRELDVEQFIEKKRNQYSTFK